VGTGVLKIGHFDYSSYDGARSDDSEIGTLWYRAPELLWPRDNLHTTQMDMWSVGCVLGQLLSGKALFAGENEFDQAMTIFK
jgi:serine/threonine protein kinase